MSLFNIERLPTPLALSASRVEGLGLDQSADSFLLVSYFFEATLKYTVISGLAGLSESSTEQSYAMAHQLVRSDGLGDWSRALRNLTSNPLTGFLHPAFGSLREWATRKRTRASDPEFFVALDQVCSLLSEVGVPSPKLNDRVDLRDLVQKLVELRGKTKAHGALGPDFYSAASAPYAAAVSFLASSVPQFGWHWLHLRRKEPKPTHAVRLIGPTTIRIRDSESVSLAVQSDGLYIQDPSSRQLFALPALVRHDLECRAFQVPNGGYRPASGEAEFIDFGSGVAALLPARQFASPPAQAPKSATHGGESLEVHSNLWGNLPAMPTGYVARPRLQRELLERLRDRNHQVVTLHGQGGAGKTTLALHAAHTLASEEPTRFGSILWFSARDLELRPDGPHVVRPAVIGIADVAKLASRLVPDSEPTAAGLAVLLQRPPDTFESGVLFVFDNFETFEEVAELHRFLDSHTHQPNKVLITTRKRAFKADFPIEVLGMEREEALRMIQLVSEELQIGGSLSDAVAESIFEEAGGHPYVMRVLIGEISKRGGAPQVRSVLAKREDVLDAVFERSFNGLSADARRVFLVVASWHSAIPHFALFSVLSQRGIRVEPGIEECERLSLVVPTNLSDGELAYFCPQLSRTFGRKKLQGVPDRLEIHDDTRLLQRFGVIAIDQTSNHSRDSLINSFVQWSFAEAAQRDAAERMAICRCLVSLAGAQPLVWLDVARFRKQFLYDSEEIRYALRRATEECPESPTCWLERAQYALDLQDKHEHIACLVGAADADPRNGSLLKEVAFELCRYIDNHKAEIPKVRRGVFLEKVRRFMVLLSAELDATGLSRLAWLFLLEDKTDEAIQFASLGIQRDPSNHHCRNILMRIQGPHHQ